MSEDNFYHGLPPDDCGHGSPWSGHGQVSGHVNIDDQGFQDSSVMPPSKPPPIFRSNDLMQLVERYMPSAEDHRKVYDAFLFAAEAHGDQKRADQTPYITHPLEVARFLAELHLDADTICAALLHDVPEDTERTVAEVVERFGLAVGRMVDGVTKLKRDDSLPTKQAVAIASYQKMMKAMTGDFRVVVVKLADRLHNMKTLGNVLPDKRRRVAEETSRIYVSLARRLGMNKIRRELQWLCFQNLYPWRSRIMEAALEKYLAENEEKHQQVYYSISGALEAAIPGSNVVFWEKNLFRVYEQCRQRKVDFKQQCDLLEISVQVGERAQCYQALGIIHEIFKPRMGMVRDFIAAPRAYGFQSLQTVVTASSGQLVRFQIQTREMFDMAQFGLASQWSRPETRAYTQAVFDEWSEQIKAFDSQAQNPDEFYADMQADMFQTEIYAYTPEGDVKELPRGATLLDFAYAVHTEIGHHCKGGTVDGRKLTPRSRLPNTMAKIEVLTGKEAIPHVSWLNFVKTSRARSNIRSWLRQHDALPERGEGGDGEKISVGIVVDVRDIKGMLRQITKHLDSLDVNIVDLKISGEGRVKQDAFTLQVDDMEHLQEVIRQLKRIPNVLNVSKLTK
ncbi:MAG: HD domain-containing protein [Thiothrix sp.]